MSKSVAALLLLMCPPPVALAQSPPTTPTATKQDPQAAYHQLVKDMDQAVEEWRTAAPDVATEVPPQIKKVIERACKLADEYAGKDDAVRFLAFICKRPYQQKDALRMAVKRLAEHAESELIGDALDHLQSAIHFGSKADVDALLDAVVKRNKTADCLAHALLVRGCAAAGGRQVGLGPPCRRAGPAPRRFGDTERGSGAAGKGRSVRDRAPAGRLHGPRDHREGHGWPGLQAERPTVAKSSCSTFWGFW